MQWVYDDAGHGHHGRNCVARAIAIATGLPYDDIAARINASGRSERRGKRKTERSLASKGVYTFTERRVLAALGWRWVPTMTIGSGCKVHLRDGELPPGRLIVSVSRHTTAVIDGVIHDTHDPSRGGTRCVYGYYIKD